MTLHEAMDAVVDEQSFMLFVKALIENRNNEVGGGIDEFGRGKHGWENHTIEAFLEAAHAWAEATDFGASQGLTEASLWKRFAVFLYCGKIYE